MPHPDWHQSETYKSLIGFSTELFKVLALINGGAAVALLSYMGAYRSQIADIDGLKLALLFYAIGVACIPLALAMAYLTQFAMFYEGEGMFKRRYHLLWLAAGATFVVFSGGFFVLATWTATAAA